MLIALIALAHIKFKLNGILAFWLDYILTRPLGDYLSQPHDAGGLGLGTVGTSALFLAAILGLVIYLVTTRRDTITSAATIP